MRSRQPCHLPIETARKQRVRWLLAPSVRADTIAVDLRLAGELPRLWADPHHLQQVVVNLVTNAQQALRAVAAPRQLTLATAYDPASTRVTLEVADTGLGMPPAIQARIFEFRATRVKLITSVRGPGLYCR
jgi:signal transduction histidine kinase